MGWYIVGLVSGEILAVCILAIVTGDREEKLLKNVSEWARKTKGIDLGPLFKEYQEETRDKG